MTEERLRVLLLDDEKSLREPLKDYLKKNFGYHVDAVASGEEALRLVEEAQGHYDVALIDEVLTDGLNGIQVMQEINVRYPDVESIIFTGWGNESRQRALQAGAFRYLEKPFDTDELAMLIRTAGQQVRLRDIGRAILSERDLDRVLERIDAAASSLALADEAAITLQNPVTGKIQVYTKTYTAKQEWKKHFRDRDLSREIIQTGQMVRVSDTKQDDRVNPEVIEAGIRSFVGVPIPGEGGSLGVLYVYSQQSGRFDEGSTVAVLQTLASQAGLAIANARAFQQTQAHAGYMEALVRAGQGLTRTTRLEDQLAIAWNFVRNQLKVATFFVGLYDKQADMLRFPLAYDEDRQMEIPNRRLGDDPKQWGITGHVVKTGQELCWFRQEDARKQCRSLGIKGIQVGKPCQSCFYLPLKIGDEVVGAVSIQSYDRYAFTSTLLDACRALGGQLAVALENARLFQAEAQQRQEAETLREIALALTTTLEQQEIFERILSELQKVVPYDSASVQLLKGDCLEIIAGRGFPNLSEVLGASFPVDGDNPNREVMRKRLPLIVSDAQAEYPGFSQKPLFQADIHGWLGVPMLIGDRLIGMIALDKHELGFYGEKHTRLAQTFAAQAAVAIENARLFQEREFLLEISKMVSSAQDLDQSLQTLAERLVHSLVVTFCRISLLDDTGKTLTTRAAYPIVGDLAWNPGIGQQYLLSEAPDEAGAIETGQSQILRREENPGLFSSLERKAGFQGVLKAAVLIPLTVGGKVFGVITLGERRSWERGSFALERVALCEAVADQVAALIARMRLQEQIQRELQEKAKLLEQVSKARDTARVVAEVSVLEDLRSTLNSIAKGTQDVLHCDAVTLYTYDQTRDEFGFPPAMVGVKYPREVLKLGSVARDSVTQRILPLDEAHVTEDAPSDQLMGGSFVKREGIKSSVGVPLKVGDHKVGVMFVNYRSHHRFTGEEITNMKLFALQAAVAIRNAQLYEEAMGRAIALQALYEAGKAVTSTLALDEILSRIAEQAWKLTSHHDRPARFSHLALVEGNRLKFIAAHPPEHLPGLQREIGDINLEHDERIDITGRAVKTGESQLIDDVTQDQGYTKYDVETRSELAVPIMLGELVIGVINVEHPDYGAFDKEDQRDLESLATQAAIAIQNARQYEELKRTKGLVGARTALAWMGMASSAWRHAIDKHALTIREQAQLLSRDLSMVQPDERYSRVAERLSMIVRLANQMLEKPLIPPLSMEEGVESVVLNELIGERAGQLWQNDPYRTAKLQLDLQLPNTATVRASPEWLRRAFDILVDNSVDAVAGCEVQEIVIGTRSAVGGAEIFVSDAGPGIPEEIRAKIGLELIEKPEDARGLGMGLLIAQTIVQAYGGEIHVDSTGPTGTTIVIWLPLEK